MFPTPAHYAANSANGIAQVVLHLAKHLPAFGWQVMDSPAQADLIAHHAGDGKGACDVSHIHGLYPTGVPGFPAESWHTEINNRVIESMRTASAVTVPSQWVADILRRDMHIAPDVIAWAVDPEDWQHSHTHEGYVLWAKNRVEGVCTPDWLNRLAKAAPDVPFVSTFGDTSLANLTVTGQVKHAHMRYLIQRAGVYLATTKETGDIGSREALAAGVPVLGFRHGAITDFIVHGYNGFLAEPNDFNGLLNGLRWCLQHRDQISQNALKTARGFHWSETARQVAAVYDRVLAGKQPPLISVIIPNYNYGAYLPQAVDSVLHQQCATAFEVIVVDDGSTDPETLAVLDSLEQRGDLTVIRQRNGGVASARNRGIAHAAGSLIACLDADDTMEQGFLQVCSAALLADRGLGIAYTGLQINSNGGANAFPAEFNYRAFQERHNQVPSLCMFRKTAWQRAGGFRQYRSPAEDADLWLRIAALGWRVKKVTDQPLFNYTMHEHSLSHTVRTGQKADPFQDRSIGYASGFGAGGSVYPVRNYDQPEISVIIPVGKGHETLVKRALDSVEGQTFTQWEVIVVNDSGHALALDGYPYAKVLATTGATGASHARNIGIEAAQGKFVIFLDADDYLHTQFMQKTLAAYRQTGRYVYTDWYMLTKQGALEYHECPEFSPRRIFNKGYFHPITALVPAQDAKRLRFDESMKSWEDVDFYMRLIISGVCGVRVPEALLTYPYMTGTLREWGADHAPQLRAELLERYNDYIEKGKEIVCCGKQAPKPNTDDELVKVIYQSPLAAKHTVIGSKTRTNYGRRAGGDLMYVKKEDLKTDAHKFQPAPDIQPEVPQTATPAGVIIA